MMQEEGRRISERSLSEMPLEFTKQPAAGPSYGKGWTGLLVALLLGDRQNTLCNVASIRTKVFSGWYWRFRWPLVYALLRELRSLPFRILATHETEIDH